MTRHVLKNATIVKMNILNESGSDIQRCLAKLWLAANGSYEFKQNTKQLQMLIEASLEDSISILDALEEAARWLHNEGDYVLRDSKCETKYDCTMKILTAIKKAGGSAKKENVDL